MTLRQFTTLVGAGCNGTGCEAVLTLPQEVSYWEGIGHLRQLMSDSGWTEWRGGPVGTRHYCPEHRPRPGHKMVQFDPVSGEVIGG